VKFFHPDRHQSSPGLLHKATEETKKLNLAYERVRKVFAAARRSTPERRTHEKPPPAQGSGNPPIHGQAFTVATCGVKLKWVAAGHFQMGSPTSEAGRSNQHLNGR
jgi:hypothetical protein